MKKIEKTPQFLKKRKFYVLLPVLVLPFISLFFMSLDGGKKNEDLAAKEPKGFNMNLPDAALAKDKTLDKISYYDIARKDSVRTSDLQKADPYAKDKAEHQLVIKDDLRYPEYKSNHLNTSPYTESGLQDPNEAKVYKKLDQLNAALNQPPAIAPKQKEQFRPATAGVSSTDVDRLEGMMKTMTQKDGEDPELKQLSGMLEKILDIQHPERVQEKIKQTSELNKGIVYAVSAKGNPDQVSFFANDQKGGNSLEQNLQGQFASTGFFSLDDPILNTNVLNALTAVVNETQVLVNGSTVKLRLTTDIFINGVMIPKDNFLYGMSSLKGDRLTIDINSIQYQNSIFPVRLSIYDIDGLEGIYIPGAISRDVAKESADRAAQSFGMSTFDTSIGAQAAGAGIEAARSLIGKKVKLIKVTVKAGYQVLLRDENSK